MKLKDMKKLKKDDVLGLLGLETKHSPTGRRIGSIATMMVALLVGAGTALIFAPKSGKALRRDLRDRLRPDESKSRVNGTGVVHPGDLESRSV